MNNQKILLFGKNGQLGSVLYRKLSQYNLVAFDYPEIDFTQPDRVSDLIYASNPALIINAAAYTDVDRAENEIEKANLINGYAVEALAVSAKKIGAALIHYSTDYVFDGTGKVLYQENDQQNPINIYGSSKLLGEEKLLEQGRKFLIFRLSWMYSLTHPSFVTKVLEWAKLYETLRIVDDQVSNPAWATMVAEKTIEIINKGNKQWFDYFQQVEGVYHLTGKGSVSRFEWAKQILELNPHKDDYKVKDLLPAKSSDFNSPARRPQFSGLDTKKIENTFKIDLPNWKDSLNKALSSFG